MDMHAFHLLFKSTYKLILIISLIRVTFCENTSFVDYCLRFQDCFCYDKKIDRKFTINCFKIKELNDIHDLWKYSELPFIESLTILGCNETSLYENDFIDSRIQNLEIECPFNHIDENCFEVVHNLERLTMTGLKLTAIPAAVENLTPLTHLTLMSGKLVQVDKELQKLVNLIYLDLSNNNIEIISREAFINCRNIREFYFSSNNIKFFYPGTFRLCKNITKFYATNNALETTNGLPLKASFKNLRTLALYENKLETFPKNILSESSVLQNFYIQDNPWICDCRLLWLRRLYLNKLILDQPLVCYQPENFQDKTLAELSEKDLTRWSSGCPQDCTCTCIDENENLSIKVDCSSRHLSKFPDVFLENVSQLHLQDNFLTNPVTLDFEVLSNLKVFNLERNSIKVIDFVLPKNISTLLLAQNNIARFLINPSTSVSVWTLSGNPWICDCETTEFRKWMLSEKNKIEDINAIRCNSDRSPEHLKGKAVIFLSEADLCPAYKNIYVIISFSIMSLVILVLLTIFLYNYYHYHVKVWLFCRGFTFLKRENYQDQGKIHDAFISSADEDFRIVEELLIPELERKPPYYSLFEPRRDMRADVPFKYEKEMEEILKSKRIIILLSEIYVNNNFLMKIFKFAFTSTLEENVFRLIPIIVGNLPSLSNVDLSLRILLKSAQCLRFHENMFREKLLFAMPKKHVQFNDSQRTPNVSDDNDNDRYEQS